MKKNKKAQLRSKCDVLWHNKLLKESCELCGSSEGLQVHHFFYKGSHSHLRYDLDNGITICSREHFVLHHRDPKLITDRIIEIRGQEWYNSLKEKAKNNPSSFKTIKYYTDLIESL